MKSEGLVRWQEQALRDLEETHAFLAERNPEAARRFARQILEASERLETHPRMGRIAQDLWPANRYRSLVVGHCRLIYRIEDNVIWLLRVWDTRRNPENLMTES